MEVERDGLEVLGGLAVCYDWEASTRGLEGLTLNPRGQALWIGRLGARDHGLLLGGRVRF